MAISPLERWFRISGPHVWCRVERIDHVITRAGGLPSWSIDPDLISPFGRQRDVRQREHVTGSRAEGTGDDLIVGIDQLNLSPILGWS